MGLDKLAHLYREVLLDHAQHPRNRGELADPTHQMELLNPTCGDAVIVQCRLVAGKVEAVAFHGSGCSISIASASMMTEVLIGQTLDQALALVAHFNHLISGRTASLLGEANLDEASGEASLDETTLNEANLNEVNDEATASLNEALKDAYFLEGLKQFPSRYKCGVLAWKAFELGVKNQQTGSNPPHQL